MLGFGAAGSLLTFARATERTAPSGPMLSLGSALYGLAVIGAFFLATRIEIDTLAILAAPRNLLRLGALYAVLVVPFLLGGVVVGYLLSRHAEHVSWLYFFDLVGSAIGGAVSVLLLGWLGSSATVMLGAALALLASVVFALDGGRGRRRALLAAPLPAVAVLLAGSLSGGIPWLSLPSLDWHIPNAPGKEFARYGERVKSESVRLPSAIAEVEVTDELKWPPIIGGSFGLGARRLVDARMVAQDGAAPTMLFRDAADLETHPFLRHSSSGVAHVAMGARGGGEPDVLVIGVGGGVDVMVALDYGARSVTAVEINDAMIGMVTDRYADYLGGLFSPGAHPLSDRVQLVHGEGRSFGRLSSQSYDVIQMSGVDSFTALSTGAYTLSEGYLYTVEAVKDFYSRLRPDGYIVYSRFIMRPPHKPRETLRLANVARQALVELGVDDPASQIGVFQGEDWASTLIKRGPFERVEVEALRRFASEEGFWGWVHDPHPPGAGAFPGSPRYDEHAASRFRRAIERGEIPVPGTAGSRDALAGLLHRAYLAGRYGSEPARDEALRSAALLADPEQRAASGAAWRELVEDQVRRARAADEPFDEVRGYFATLLRGSDADRAAFLASYPYDVGPAHDDAPFFFNYYRYSSLLAYASPPTGEPTRLDVYHPEYPVGHVVLIASLVQITLLAALLILLPLRGRAAGDGPGTLRWFAYFAGLGMGFMLIEIVMMQKMVLFLGHPTYAIVVVLCGLLTFAGVGSMLSGRIRAFTPSVARKLLAAIVSAIAVDIVALTWILPRMLGWPLVGRIVLVWILLLPLGTALGMAFPLGIRVLSRRRPMLLPWAWAVNGFLSVFSSIFCIVLAMAIGFTNVLLIAAGVYAVGLLAVAPILEEDTPT
jgi:SAM-dependent methyltransferase